MDDSPAYVLYVDHQGHPAPLSMIYHATASRRLASAVDRHPPSTVTEVDSAFCPQCLAFHDANTASNIGYCPKPSCRKCPLCQSIVSISVEDKDCFYKCGLCDWTSQNCNLATTVPIGDDGTVKKEDLEKAVGDLGRELSDRQRKIDQNAEEHYTTMLHSLESMAKEVVKGQRSTTYYGSAGASMRRGMDGLEGWSVQALEDSIKTRSRIAVASNSEIVSGQELQLVSLEAAKKLDDSLKDKPAISVLLQGGCSRTSLNDLLPLPIPLRPRKSRRCRAELAEGRPGILVKPKLNPLEGDSSLRTGHGQWWKKDSSAIHVIPRVRVTKHGSNGSNHAILIKVTNPTLGTIRLRLKSSGYVGEPVWESQSERNTLLEKVLVDSMAGTSIDAKLDTETAQGLGPTELCQLEPAEDSFLELGKSSNEEPEAIQKWDASSVLENSAVSKETSSSTLRLVAQNSSKAWFEVVVLENVIDESLHTAIPLALQVEVGEGSWESSLIQPGPIPEGETKDFVTFDLLITWKS